MRSALAALTLVLLVAFSGCGSGDDTTASAPTADEISTALHVHTEGNRMIYDVPNGGQSCLVEKILTSADQVSAADSGDRNSAVATNDSGDFGVAFTGIGGFPPAKCVDTAEEYLDTLD